MLPATYRALVLREPGPVSNFVLKQLPLVAPSSNQVLVKVSACAVAFRDIVDRQGGFRFIKKDTVLGHEFAGTVAAVGAGAASQYAVGAKVASLHWDQNAAWPSPLTADGAVDSMFGLTCHGGYAEYCLANPGALVQAAPHVSLGEASCVVSTFGTVWCAAVTRGRLKSGERILVTGASGGVGVSAVRLAKSLGCVTTAVTTNANKKDFLLSLGADHVVIADASGKYKAPPQDMVIECVGGPTFPSSLRSVTPGGRLVLVGNVNNAKVEVPLGFCILNSVSIIGSDSIHRDDYHAGLLPHLEKHGLRPAVDREVGLEEAPAIHTVLEQRGAKGRVILRIAPESS